MTIEDDQARFLKCIGEPTRLRILKLLAGGEKCVGEVVKVLDKEQSLVSHHLRALKDCNIVVVRQEAQKIYYALTDPALAELVFKCEAIMKELPVCQIEAGAVKEEERGDGARAWRLPMAEQSQ